MTMNRLKLNADKTQLIWLGTRQHLAKLTVTQLQLTTSVAESDSVVTEFDVVLDISYPWVCMSLPFPDHYQLRQLRVVQRSLTEDALRSMVQVFNVYTLSVGLV